MEYVIGIGIGILWCSIGLYSVIWFCKWFNAPTNYRSGVPEITWCNINELSFIRIYIFSPLVLILCFACYILEKQRRTQIYVKRTTERLLKE